WRATLVRASEREHVLVFVMHEIVADTRSLKVLFSELAEAYRNLARGKRAELRKLPLQYADFAIWQRTQSQNGVWEGEVVFWKQCLAGAPALLELPIDHPRPAVQSYRSAIQTRLLPKSLAEGLRSLSLRERENPHQASGEWSIYLAALAVLLKCYSRQND